MPDIKWLPDAEFLSADRAEHAIVDATYELIAYALSPEKKNNASSRVIGWEIFTGDHFLTLLRQGESNSFQQAKRDAELALRQVQKTAR
jgi:hypothetical protein